MIAREKTERVIAGWVAISMVLDFEDIRIILLAKRQIIIIILRNDRGMDSMNIIGYPGGALFEGAIERHERSSIRRKHGGEIVVRVVGEANMIVGKFCCLVDERVRCGGGLSNIEQKVERIVAVVIEPPVGIKQAIIEWKEIAAYRCRRRGRRIVYRAAGKHREQCKHRHPGEQASESHPNRPSGNAIRLHGRLKMEKESRV